MRKLLVAAVAASLTLLGSMTTARATTLVSTASATFSANLTGTSQFVQTGTSVTVTGSYSRLKPGHSYFTVVYGNGNCDPAAAFPVGPFVANSFGVATLSTTLTAPAGLVAGTMSMSVRRGDSQMDRDHDGLLGPSDVVAIPGHPKVGLIECNYHPVVT